MPNVRLAIALFAAVSLAAAQLVCACGPTGFGSSADSLSINSSRIQAPAADMSSAPGHHSMPDVIMAPSVDHHDESKNCCDCTDTTSEVLSHCEVVPSDGVSYKLPELALIGFVTFHNTHSTNTIQRNWPPPGPSGRRPETLVSLKTLLLI
jgi:hypothetical protein